MENGQIIKDDNVPFVKTIAGVTRHANGQMMEYVFPITMPAFWVPVLSSLQMRVYLLTQTV